MAKKTNTKIENEKIEDVGTEQVLESPPVETVSLRDYPTISIRQLALHTKLTYGLLLKESKRPVADTIYDPDMINYDALDAYLTRRNAWPSVEDLETLASSERTSRGRSTIERSPDDYPTGTQVTIFEQYKRKNEVETDEERVFEVVFSTSVDVVLQLVGTQQLACKSWTTFFSQRPKMVDEDNDND